VSILSSLSRLSYCVLHCYDGVCLTLPCSFHTQINRWRVTTLRQPRVHGFIHSSNLIAASKIPFSAMWSPAFLPRPDDWPEQCEVVGTFVVNQAQDFDTTPFGELKEWLDNGEPKPVFIGFGSMMVKNVESLEAIIKGAAEKSNTRVIVQSGWTKLDVEDGSGLCRNVG